MPFDEIFPKATVKQVIFQITYPNLLYLEKRIGDFQLKIMSHFPESSEIYRKIIFGISTNDDNKDPNKDQVLGKIWQFVCPNKYRLNVMTDSLDISSEFHKTYNNPSQDDKFRDIVELVLNKFFEIAPIPFVKRIGLRYVNECYLPENLNNDTFCEYYNTSFPLQKYNISDAQLLEFNTTFKVNSEHLKHSERLFYEKELPKYILDFDGFSNNVVFGECLSVLDKLHVITGKEFKRIVKQPVIDIMRQTGV